MDAFTCGYIECALWSSMDDACTCDPQPEDPATASHPYPCKCNEGGEPMGKNYDESDIAPETLAKMVKDCKSFQRTNASDLEGFDPARAGHDFWLTRNGHGAGFWDGDYPEPQATRLTDAAHRYGTVDLYIGDDRRVHA